ncbi:OmpA family protein [Rufibacter hautae]|uniref:OmpA family protein n=1 Tax=Rufibacter hautae TaxID=2595005 RepID=A0A5B6TT30_9BACT|nr:OmpA family protein [Rufibacter hautae]KAA3439658.1 OmpA family protein [Rufibacter hautae]
MNKRLSLLGGALALSLLVLPAHAQFNIGDKLKSKVNEKIDAKLNKTADQVTSGKKASSGAAKESEEAATEETAAEGTSAAPEAKAKVWTKYDFVPGDKVLFADNLKGEENGEFPSRWDLKNGNAEVASFGGTDVIHLVSNGTAISPLMKTENYLPETFTVEMDVYFDSDNPNMAYEIYFLSDLNKYNEATHGMFWDPIVISPEGVHFKNFGSNSAELQATGTKSQWRHVSIAFNKRSMKVYLDQHRLINIPNTTGKPVNLKIKSDRRIEGNAMVKNVFIAEGGKKLYDQVLATGKIVTYGVKFDTNKAVIRPESMGTLNSIVKLMQEQPSLNFSVDGHTDSDGDDASNLKLSQQRAEAVKTYLVSQGIADSRLKAKGQGESKPLDKGTTVEAKANNRRVEFVKI